MTEAMPNTLCEQCTEHKAQSLSVGCNGCSRYRTEVFIMIPLKAVTVR